MIQRNLLAIVFLFIGISSFAQSVIFGTVTDETGVPVEGADVFVDGTDYYFYTEADGSFQITVEPGTYDFVVSSFGFDEYMKTITIEPNQKLEWLPVLTTQAGDSTVELNQIVVTADADNEGEEAVMQMQRESVEIKEIKGAAELSRLGKSDAAQAVAAIAGVSKQESTNDVYVRGLGDRYLNTSLNGLSLPSNDINKKNIDLNLFGSDVIQNVSVSKAFSSRLNGDFAAGSVDIASKEHTGKDYLEISIGSRVNSNAIGEDMIQSEGTNYFGLYGRYNDHPFASVLQHQIGPEESKGISPFSTNGAIKIGKSFRFADNMKLSIFATGSFSNGFNYLEGEQQNYSSLSTLRFPNVRKYQYNTVSTGLLSAVLRVNSKNELKYTSLLINNSSDEVGHYGYKGLGYKRDVGETGGFYQTNVQFNQELMFVNQLVGEHDLTDDITFDWGAGYNVLKANEPDRKRISIGNYSNLLDNDPNTVGQFTNTTQFDSQRYFQDIYDEEVNGRMNFKIKFDENIAMNIGGNSRYKTRDFESTRYGYDFINQDIGSTEDINEFFSAQNWLVNYNTYVLNPIRVDLPDGTNVVNISQTNMPGFPENLYDASLINFASYIDFEWQVSENLLIIPGVRFESVKQQVDWDVNNLSILYNPGEVESKSEVLLPNLNIKYALNPDTNLRFSASQTLSFPEFKEFAPFLYEGVTQRIGGNPDLLGHTDLVDDYTNVEDVAYSKILNLDAKYEWFMNRSEMLSIAAFYKTIQDPINLVTGTSATADEYFFRTGEEARVFGIEVDLRKDLYKTDDTEFFLGFNGAWMDTNQDLYSEIGGTRSVTFNREEEELQGASDIIVNADLNWKQKWGNIEPTFTLVGNYFSDRIFSLGSGQIGNKIEKGFTTLDFLVSTEIGRNSTFKIGAKNLINPDMGLYREIEGGEDATLEEFKRGRIFSFEFAYKF